MTLDLELIVNRWGWGKVIGPGGPIPRKFQVGPLRVTYLPWSEIRKHAINFEIGVAGSEIRWRQTSTGEVLPTFPKKAPRRKGPSPWAPVHVLHRGLPLCGFTTAIPSHWPQGTTWVSVREVKDGFTHPDRCRTCWAKVPRG